jgi:hypothetical protein
MGEGFTTSTLSLDALSIWFALYCIYRIPAVWRFKEEIIFKPPVIAAPILLSTHC